MKEKYFTVVFGNDVRKLAENPFDISSEFGPVVGVSIGDVMAERDRYYEALEEIARGIGDPVAVACAALEEGRT